jgi:hypothetical protein
VQRDRVVDAVAGQVATGTDIDKAGDQLGDLLARTTARYERTAFRPTTCSRRAASASARPSVPLPSRAKTSGTPSVAASAAVTGDGTTAPCLLPETVTATRTSLSKPH